MFHGRSAARPGSVTDPTCPRLPFESTADSRTLKRQQVFPAIGESNRFGHPASLYLIHPWTRVNPNACAIITPIGDGSGPEPVTGRSMLAPLMTTLAGWLRPLAGVALLAFAAPVLANDGVLLQPVADGVFVYTGPHAEADADNEGSVGNAVLVVGEESAALIDTGGSLHFGSQLRAAVAQATHLPLRYVIVTHVHPDHMFGAAAFSDTPDVEFVAHHKMPRALAARGEHYQRAFERLVGEAFAGTTLVTPGTLVENSMRLDLGNRPLLLTAHRTAHTDHDLSVLDERDGILFSGDLVFVERLPVVDGSLKGWLQVMDEMRVMPASRVVPGHGPAIAPWPDALEAQARYLDKLLVGVRGVIASGGTIDTAIETVAADERDEWQMFERDHPRNVTASFTELEWE